MTIPDFSSSSILEKTEDGYITKGYTEGNVNAEVIIGGANLQLSIESIE